MVTESEIRKSNNRTNEIRSGLETASSFAPAALGTKVISKVLPFLSQYIPEDLAYKGINKVWPELGNFLKNGVSKGLSLKSGLDFIKNEFDKETIKKEEPKQSGNIIKQYSPELHQFLDDEIRKGRGVLEAGADAARNKGFKNIISMITKDHKSPWSAILKTVYGEGLTKQQGVKQFNEHKKNNSLIDEEMQRFENGYGNNQQQQQGQGSAALMAILQKLQQSRGT